MITDTSRRGDIRLISETELDVEILKRNCGITEPMPKGAEVAILILHQDRTDKEFVYRSKAGLNISFIQRLEKQFITGVDMKCHRKGCDNEAAEALDTGLCLMCQSTAKKMVADGKTTWQELASLDMIKTKDSKTEFEKEFDKVKESSNA